MHLQFIKYYAFYKWQDSIWFSIKAFQKRLLYKLAICYFIMSVVICFTRVFDVNNNQIIYFVSPRWAIRLTHVGLKYKTQFY